MQNSNNNDNQSGVKNNFIEYRRVNPNRGAVWLIQGFKLFNSSLGAWFSIATFLFILLLLPAINTIAALLMPIGIGGLMLGCQQISSKGSLKFKHLFSAIKSDGKELLALSVIYALASIAVVVASRYILLLFGVDVAAALPENVEQMTGEQLIEWMNNRDISDLSPVLLSSLVTLLLMIPLFMAYWFAPALIVLKKMSAVNSMKLSFLVCKANLLAFLIYGLVAFGYLMLFLLFISIAAMIMPPLAGIAVFAGMLAIIAISIASIYTAYVDIFGQQDTHSNIGDSSDPDSSMIA